MSNRRKLKNLLINSRFQMRYVFLIAAAGVGLSLVNTAVFYHYIRENYAILVELSPMTDEAKTQLYSELRQIVTLLSLFSLGFIGVMVGLGLYLSHRTAGPLYHFKRVFDEITVGKRDARIHLRPNDDFQEVADSFNRMMDQVADRSRDSGRKAS